MENYIQLHFANLKQLQQGILVAQLADIGFDGFEEGADFLKAYISKSLFDEPLVRQLINKHQYTVTIDTIEPKNWNEIWEKSFTPVIIEDFCAIRAGFHQPVADVQHEIIITPKMSFGTGHHATTHQVIQFMEQIHFSGKDVLDFGTGTGVLAILAEKLGAVRILAIDNDEWSIENAAENIIANDCSKIILEKAEGLFFDNLFDVILANLNKHLILQNLPAIAKHLKVNGVLLLSGLLEIDLQEIADAALKEHLVIKKHLQKSGWIALYILYVNPE